MQTPPVLQPDHAFHTLLDHYKKASLRTSGIWLLLANLSFVLFLFGRHQFRVLLDPHADVAVSGPVLDKLALIFLVFIILLLPVLRFIRSRTPAMVLAFLVGLYWAVVFHYMLTSDTQQQLVFPLFCMLIFTALIALYPTMPILYSFTLPLWFSLFFHLILLKADIPVLEIVAMIVASALFETARIMLSRWFVLSVRRECDNQLLVSKLDNLAHYDPLTGVANRRQLDKQLQQLIAQTERQGGIFSLIMIDVDYFKKYNDHYGHQAGDNCLVDIAKCFRQVVRQPADLVARYGGEEFVILLHSAAATDAEVVAQRIRQSVAQAAIPHALSQVADTVTVSQGIMQWSPGMTSLELLQRADSALYDAKHAGRNGYCVGQ
ncbi:membrane-associated sensor domain-containing protein [Rahnella sp. L72c]|uniref:diguanylate cyclase n=1 Tax=Rahnella perminowiae TaxID=2816244 RepID=A0ABS6L494_9GAMM|nr:membrane-associated sensor domain-containing protein [Rahnella perminowiae]MBU9836500.1 membrane-associated sensor domain-containing protein [Rahnella perminowiae]